MVDVARGFGEQIGGIRISKHCRLIDALSCGLAECGERRRNDDHVFLSMGDAEWIWHEKGALSRYLDDAICRAAQPAGALCDKVGIVLSLA